MSEVNYEVLTKPFPANAVKQRKGQSGKMLSYLEAHAVIRRLIEATGNSFGFSVLGVDIQDTLVTATVELEIAGSKRQQVGSQRMNGGNNDDAIKAAISDGLKKAATLFGVGLELYGPDYESEAPQHSQSARPVQSQPEPQSSDEYARTQRQGGNGNGQRTRVGFRPLQAAG